MMDRVQIGKGLIVDPSYKQLADRLDALPNGFPPTDDGAELRLLAHLFTPEEAVLTAQLRLTKETPAAIAERVGGDAKALRKQLKALARRGLIEAGRAAAGGMGYGLLPFVVGIYEFQIDTIDEEFSRLFEDYYQKALGPMLSVEPAVHRVIPVNESVDVDLSIQPYESAAALVNEAKAWGVVDCICRTQQELIGNPCGHPKDVCMTLSEVPGVFDKSSTIQALTREEALAKLQYAADAGLVHSVGNHKNGHWYICNCCTCSCGVLRGIAEHGIANSVVRSAFLNTVDADQCCGCENCVAYCQFDALNLNDEGIMTVSAWHCVGCGVCVSSCPEDAMRLVRRPEDESPPIAEDMDDWNARRAANRGMPLDNVL
jgi:electron transport complex protein RnfB